MKPEELLSKITFTADRDGDNVRMTLTVPREVAILAPGLLAYMVSQTKGEVPESITEAVGKVMKACL